MHRRVPQVAALILSASAMTACAPGMVMSFVFFHGIEHAGHPGRNFRLRRGAILIGSGLISLAVVASGSWHAVRGAGPRAEGSPFHR